MKECIKIFTIIMVLVLLSSLFYGYCTLSNLQGTNEHIYYTEKCSLIITTGWILILSILVLLIKKAKNIVTVQPNIEPNITNIETNIETNIAISTESQVKPVFSSTFIQYWFSQSFDSNRWIAELTMLKDIGINEIILETIADTGVKYAVYPTKIPGYTCNDIDMVGTVLSVADSLGMKVRIGLGFNNEWWTMNASSQDWLNSEASINNTIAKEILNMYGTHASFQGWYIPHEFCQLTAINTTQQSYLNSFLKQITSDIKINSVKDIMIAPFYSGKSSLLVSWSTMLQNILTGTGITIVALQDSIGAGFNNINQLDSLYSYTKRATDVLGIKLYADTETFDMNGSKYISAPQKSISKQLSIESKYVQGFVAFSIDHYQNRNVVSQESNYNDYYDYYLFNK